MKKFYTLFVGLLLSISLSAVPTTPLTSLNLEVTSGNLSSLINERSLLTNLKLTGTIDARDFTTMRDSLPALDSVDLSEVTITAYKGPLGPGGDTYYSANHIPHRAFYLKSGLKYLVAPTSIVSIGNNAFRGSSLGGIFDVPEGVTSIGSYVFSGCENLTEVIIHDNVTEIGGYAFENCTGLTTINLPDGLTEIGTSSFRGCSYLTSIHIPSSVNVLGSSAFRDCNRLSSVKLNASITVLEDYMFRGDTAIKGTLVLPETLSAVKISVFEKCSGIDTVYVPNSVKTIGELAFADCKGLKAIILPDTLEYISAKTFSNDSLLEMVKMPFVLDSISFDAFRNCVSIKKMVIPDVKHIGENAFRSCSGLDTIFSLARIPVDLTNSPNVFHFVDKEECRLIVPYKSLDAYKAANQWQEFFNIEEAISFNLDSLASSADGTKVDSVSATSGLTWGVSPEDDWVTISPERGRGDKVFKFTLGENKGESSRETKVVFNIYDLFVETLTLMQKASPVITWELPDSITVGTVISAEMLNASTNIDGEFTYTPEIGTTITAGESQSFSVIFTPKDTVNYNKVYFNGSATIVKKTPEVSFEIASELAAGDTITSDVVTTSSNIEGTFEFVPELGTVISKGDAQEFKVTFIPTDADNYSVISKVIKLDIVKSVPVITWDVNKTIVQGDTISASLFGLSTEIEGVYTFVPEEGSALEAGDNQTINVTFIPSDAANYVARTKTITVNVESAASELDVTALNLDGLNGSSDELKITSNTYWSILIDVDWITATPSSGKGNGTVVFSAEANTTGSERTATVTFSAVGKDDVKVTVVQKTEGGSSVSDQKMNLIKVYPNPAIDHFAVAGYDGVANVSIFDLTGKLVQTGIVAANEDVAVTDFNAGVYFIVVKTAEGSSTFKLIKK